MFHIHKILLTLTFLAQNSAWAASHAIDGVLEQSSEDTAPLEYPRAVVWHKIPLIMHTVADYLDKFDDLYSLAIVSRMAMRSATASTIDRFSESDPSLSEALRLHSPSRLYPLSENTLKTPDIIIFELFYDLMHSGVFMKIEEKFLSVANRLEFDNFIRLKNLDSMVRFKKVEPENKVYQRSLLREYTYCLYNTPQNAEKLLELAEKLLELAEKQGCVEAQHCVAQGYAKGIGGFPKDIDKLFELAEQQNWAWAQRYIAQGYADGKFGFPPNAAKLLELAEVRGWGHAERYVAQGYAYGWYGIPQNINELLRLAEIHRCREAQGVLARLYAFGGPNFPKNQEKLFELAQRGWVVAQDLFIESPINDTYKLKEESIRKFLMQHYFTKINSNYSY